MKYVPSPIPTDPKEIPRFINDELNKLSDILQNIFADKVEFRNTAPAKPREGMLYGADGTNWNPGSGKGVYCYYGGAWSKL